MYTVEILNGSVWEQASAHTLMEDALDQAQRFVNSGISAENLRLVKPDVGQA
jgi:hypothetical protein